MPTRFLKSKPDSVDKNTKPCISPSQMLFSKSSWDLREYLLTATLPEITGVGMSDDGPLIVPAGHKSHANHLSTRPSPHRLLKTMYILDHEMLRSSIRVCAYQLHFRSWLALTNFPVISSRASRHVSRTVGADPATKERITISNPPHFVTNLPCPFSDPQCIDE